MDVKVNFHRKNARDIYDQMEHCNRSPSLCLVFFPLDLPVLVKLDTFFAMSLILLSNIVNLLYLKASKAAYMTCSYTIKI